MFFFIINSHTIFVPEKENRKQIKEVNVMNCKSKNSSIRCTVSQCAHNMESENYCTLNTIDVGTHEANPTMPQCTDCNSFVKRS